MPAWPRPGSAWSATSRAARTGPSPSARAPLRPGPGRMRCLAARPNAGLRFWLRGPAAWAGSGCTGCSAGAWIARNGMVLGWVAWLMFIVRSTNSPAPRQQPAIGDSADRKISPSPTPGHARHKSATRGRLSRRGARIIRQLSNEADKPWPTRRFVCFQVFVSKPGDSATAHTLDLRRLRFLHRTHPRGIARGHGLPFSSSSGLVPRITVRTNHAVMGETLPERAARDPRGMPEDDGRVAGPHPGNPNAIPLGHIPTAERSIDV